MVASAPSPRTAASRARRSPAGGKSATGKTSATAPMAKTIPSAKVTRPEKRSAESARAVHSESSMGRWTRTRTSSQAATVAEAVVASTPVVRTPSQPIR